MNTIQFLNSLRPAIPMSVEKPCTLASNGELKRWCNDKAVIINGEPVSATEEIDFPVFSLVFFPKGKRKTTVI